MEQENDPQQSLKDIQRMMQRSSRFISLSGLSGVAAGAVALIGAWIAYPFLYGNKPFFIDERAAAMQAIAEDYSIYLNIWLFWIALGTLIAAVAVAFLFTMIKSRKDGVAIWGYQSRRVALNLFLPMAFGSAFLLIAAIKFGDANILGPGSLLIYGLALLNASTYTMPEIRWLAISELVLALLSLFFSGEVFWFWVAGFGLLHIVYGIVMWNRYERHSINQPA